jgi:hypothetical protein
LVAGILGWKLRRSDEWGVEEVSLLTRHSHNIKQTDGYMRCADTVENALGRERLRVEGFIDRVSYVPDPSSLF